MGGRRGGSGRGVGGGELGGEGPRKKGEAGQEEKYKPKERREHLGSAPRDHHRCRDAHAEGAAKPANGERESDENLREQLQLAARGAQRVHEEPPAQAGNGGKLGSWVGRDFTHDRYRFIPAMKAPDPYALIHPQIEGKFAPRSSFRETVLTHHLGQRLTSQASAPQPRRAIPRAIPEPPGVLDE